MLAVVGILCLVAVFTVPAVRGMSRGGRGQQAASVVMSALDQARAAALRTANDCYLVMAANEAEWSDEYRGRAYCIFEESYQQATGKFVLFPLTEWKLLPEGTCFSPDADTVFASAADAKAAFPCKPAGKDDLQLTGIKFNAVGAIEKPSNTSYLKLRVVEGRMTTAGVQSTSPPGAAPALELRLFLLTGKAQRIQPGDTP